MIDYGQNIPILWRSIKFDISLLGEDIKSTDRLYVGYIWMKYESSDDITLTLTTRRTKVDSVTEQYAYTLSKDNNYFKQKLPPNLTCYQFWLEFEASISESFECKSIGVGWGPVKVGMG